MLIFPLLRPCRLPLFVAVFAFAAGLVRAAPPDWIREALQADTAKLEADSVAVALLHSEEARFLRGNRVRRIERHVVRTFRGGVRPIEYSYDANTEKILSARAWFITADGKLAKTFRAGDFTNRIASYGNYFWNEERILGLPAQLGAAQGNRGAIAWEIETESSQADREIRCRFAQKFPVVRATLEVVPPPGGALAWTATSAQMPPPVAGSSAGALRWSMSDIPGSQSPRPDGFLPNSFAVYVRAVSPTGVNAGAFASWPALAGMLFDVFRDRLAVVPTVAGKTAETLGDIEKSTSWKHVRRLTEFVQREIQYLSITLDTDTLAGYRPHPAAETLRLRYGDCKDKATLLVSLLEAAGVKAYVCLLHAGNPRAFPTDWPSLAFNHAIVAIQATDDTPAHWPVVAAGALGRVVLFDPTHPKVPLGVLPADDCAGHALILSENDNPGLIEIPAPSTWSTRQVETTTIELRHPNDLSIASELQFFGQNAAEMHVQQETEGDATLEDNLRKQLARQFTHVDSLSWTAHWDASAASYALTHSYAVASAGRMIGNDRVLLSPFTDPSVPSFNPWETTADGVCWIQPFQRTITSRLVLPPGASVEELPADWQARSPLYTASFQYSVENGAVVARSEVIIPSAFLARNDYLELRAKLRHVSETFRRPCVLVLPPAPQRAHQ